MDSPLSDRHQWFAAEVHPHEAHLRGYLHRLFPAAGDVEDLVQESYLRIWKVRAAAPVQSARGLLFQIARRLALDAIRHRRASPIDRDLGPGDLAVADPAPDAAEETALAERRRMLVDAVASLPGRYREIVLLRKFEDIPQREVAARLGLSERTVENLLARGIRKCEDHLRRRGAFEGGRG